MASKDDVVHGRYLDYSFTLPSAKRYQLLENVPNCDVWLERSHFAVAVSVSRISSSDSFNTAKITMDNVRTKNPNAEFSECSSFLIDGKEWVKFESLFSIDGEPMRLVVYCYTNELGSFQLMSLVREIDYPKKKDFVDAIAKSFKLPVN